MFSKIVRASLVSLIFASLGAVIHVISLLSDQWSSTQLTTTFFILAATHFIFSVVIYHILVAKLPAGKIRYTLSKTLTLTHFFVAALFILRVWLPDSSALLAAYGFIAAATAFSIQDVFKNAIGGILILSRNLFRVGDRIQFGSDFGDVIDIGILYTRLLEIKNWVAGDQPTGRIISVPNSFVITNSVHNYTSDHSFIWDEIHIPITYASDWKKAESIMKQIVTERTEHLSVTALEEIESLRGKYFLTSGNIEPSVYIETTDNWVSIYLRYIVSAKERREIQSEIQKEILHRLEQEPSIQIASETISVDATVRKPK